MFDIVIVDGRARQSCVQVGWELLNFNGIMVIHDAQRKIYTEKLPNDSYKVQTINKKINIEGNISTLFLSKSTRQINILSTLLNKELPKYITIFKNNVLMAKNKIYAGDIPATKKYHDWIGLSLHSNNLNHIQHDITNKLPFSNESIDIYQSEDVFEHIDYDKLNFVMNDTYRVLKKGGIFRLSLPDYGCEILKNRSILNGKGEIIFDPEGGGTIDNPGHRWFPRINTVKDLINKSDFKKNSTIKFLQYYKMNGDAVTKQIDHSIGRVERTPDYDTRVQNPNRPMSIVVDIIKENNDTKKADKELSNTN